MWLAVPETDKCFKKGLLRKGIPESERIEASLKLAAHYLERGEGNVKLEYYDVVSLMAYNATFQCCRALLFNDGITERSHYCAIRYTREKYASTQLDALAEILDDYRQNRHLTQYEGEKVSEKEATEAPADARKFLAKTKESLA